MLTFLGVLNFLLGFFLFIYTVGVLMYVVPRHTTKLARYGIIALWSSLAISHIISGIEVMSGVLAGLSMSNITTAVYLLFGLKILSLVGILIVLALIITNRYYKKER